MKYLASIAAATFLSVNAFAQSGGYALGDKVADFSLKDSHNQPVSLSDFANTKTVALVFTNNQCPYAKLYENRLVDLANSYGSKGVQFVFINPGVGSGDGSETLADMAAKNYSFPYLADEGQKVSRQFGATKTPEVYVLQNNNGAFVLKYKGAIDDNPQLESGVKNFYLKNVLDEVLANKTVTALNKRPTGCLIKAY
ncbi:thioredoxin family protein [Pontibacter sp. 172403-2]|uniref:thioredoxin family protein n=1 Tax=Pontibacter rufus TaxID=2791028 RepID=UPI0018AFD9A0|nr:thioredoxin family protein [Pontibacter sp. 172403-2]MBF9253381.1 thioredoxin family protein [Pontibacter sp. 172403-2]